MHGLAVTMWMSPEYGDNLEKQRVGILYEFMQNVDFAIFTLVIIGAIMKEL